MTPDPVYGNPLAEMWDVVLAVDEAAYGPLRWSRKAIYDRQRGPRARSRATRTRPTDAPTEAA